ncbi:hypothetical protein Mapa_011883 [Marchantia paleacea]|nr:hypothetical protein Mapa_011883 [Marchantia paleacea]
MTRDLCTAFESLGMDIKQEARLKIKGREGRIFYNLVCKVIRIEGSSVDLY